MQDHIYRRFPHDSPPVDLDTPRTRVHFGAELGDDLPVHADSAGGDELFRCPARSDAGLRENLL
jgi:hypothetical protein